MNRRQPWFVATAIVAAVVALVAAIVFTSSPPSPTPTPSGSPGPSVSATPSGSAPASDSVPPSGSVVPPSESAASPSGSAPASPTSAPDLPQDGEPFPLDPADFVERIDHPFWPMTPGDRWVYRETDAEGSESQVEVVVTDQTKVIEGITATVVHDTVSQDGELIEDTFDWYAQDRFGNLWYLGEDTKEYEGGEVVSTEGSWEAGVDGALAGVILPADPQVGMEYRQEYYEGEAEDQGRILSLDEQVTVPYGSFDGCLQTEDTTPLDPEVLEHKYYARGIGLVLAEDVSGGGREELLTFEGPDAP